RGGPMLDAEPITPEVVRLETRSRERAQHGPRIPVEKAIRIARHESVGPREAEPDVQGRGTESNGRSPTPATEERRRRALERADQGALVVEPADDQFRGVGEGTIERRARQLAENAHADGTETAYS